jgi:hypothetical protein
MKSRLCNAAIAVLVMAAAISCGLTAAAAANARVDVAVREVVTSITARGEIKHLFRTGE